MDTHIELGLPEDAAGTKPVIAEVTPRLRLQMKQQGENWSTQALRTSLLAGVYAFAATGHAADTILFGESKYPNSDMGAEWLWNICGGVFAHPGSKMANLIFFDGHVKTKKWLATIYPVNKNNWETGDPKPDPINRKLNGMPPCTYTAPPGPDAAVFQRTDCLAYQ